MRTAYQCPKGCWSEDPNRCAHGGRVGGPTMLASAVSRPTGRLTHRGDSGEVILPIEVDELVRLVRAGARAGVNRIFPPETPAARMTRLYYSESTHEQARGPWTLADSVRGTPAELAPVSRNLPQWP